jgi:YVTN family beta-propeller protein
MECGLKWYSKDMSSKIFIVSLVAFVAVIIGGFAYSLWREETPLDIPEKIYVAVEGAGVVKVIDPESRLVAKTIDLAYTHEDHVVGYQPHNIQVAPDGMTVWVTANIADGDHGHSSAPGISRARADTGHDDAFSDQVIVIDATTDKIIHRLDIAPGIHLAHVVLAPDSKTAYATAQMEGLIYVIDAIKYEVIEAVSLPTGSEPHGLRIFPGGQTAVIALLNGRGMATLDIRTNEVEVKPVGGAAVQAGVTPDGRYSMVSLFDSKKLAITDHQYCATVEKAEPCETAIEEIALPDGAMGPVQMYPTPDSKFVYVADQGVYLGAPQGTKVYKIDLAARKVVAEIESGAGPHGVVVNQAGDRVYVTNLVGGTVTVIDSKSDTVLAEIPVGSEPNGISVWSKQFGGTP